MFQMVCPNDSRPRKAIETCLNWVHTGEFSMAEIRDASLSAHAAARAAGKQSPAAYAARAAGQAVATAHVAQHAFGAAYYALKAIAATDPENALRNVKAELTWQSRRPPERLRGEVGKRIIIERNRKGISIKISKGPDY